MVYVWWSNQTIRAAATKLLPSNPSSCTSTSPDDKQSGAQGGHRLGAVTYMCLGEAGSHAA